MQPPTPLPSEVTLRGPVIRAKATDCGWSLRDLARFVDIPYGTLKNVTRESNPDRVRSHRAVRIARLFALPVDQIIEADQASKRDGGPSQPPEQPRRDPGPKRRQEHEERRSGPTKAHDTASAA